MIVCPRAAKNSFQAARSSSAVRGGTPSGYRPAPRGPPAFPSRARLLIRRRERLAQPAFPGAHLGSARIECVLHRPPQALRERLGREPHHGAPHLLPGVDPEAETGREPERPPHRLASLPGFATDFSRRGPLARAAIVTARRVLPSGATSAVNRAIARRAPALNATARTTGAVIDSAARRGCGSSMPTAAVA